MSSSSLRLAALTATVLTIGSAHAATTSTGGMTPPAATDNAAGIVPGAWTSTSSGFTLNQYNGGGVLTGLSFASVVSGTQITMSTSTNGATQTLNAAEMRTTLALPGTTATSTGTSTPVIAALVSRNAPVIGTNSPILNSGSYNTGNATVTDPTELAGFIGAGTVAGMATQELRVNKTIGGGTAVATVTGAAPVATITYNYSSLPHASASIGGAAPGTSSYLLDLGIVNGLSANGNFNLFNAASVFAADFGAATCASGACSVFSVGSSFASVAGGSSEVGTVGFNGPYGTHMAVFNIGYGDAAAEAGAGKVASLGNLQLTVQVTAVPEPKAYALALAGLGLMIVISRRRKASQG
ncbi:MAG: hypothetical protein JNJ71_03080 [Rubrivivax sp.]|nr:hypothetical protein [Rubrivivax sp.]